jgi:beta-amylase
VLNAAWDAGLQVASENALPCYDRDGFNKILENAKPRNDPDDEICLDSPTLGLAKFSLREPNFLSLSASSRECMVRYT